MLIFGNHSLRRKQMLIIMLTSTATLLLACAAFVWVESLGFRSELLTEISTMAQIAGSNCTAALDFNDPTAAEGTLGALRAEPPIAKASVYNAQGELFAMYERDGKASRDEFPPVQSAGQEFRGNQLRIFQPITMDGEKVGTIYVAVDLYELTDHLKRLAKIAVLVLGISLVAAFLLSMRLQRVISGPILQLAQVARSVALEKNYSVRANKQSNDELGQLVDGFNEMLVQIQERDAALQAAQEDLEERVEERTKELAESQSLYLSLVDQMPAGIFRKDPQGRFVFVNSWYCRIKGIKADQILGKTPLEIESWILADENVDFPVAERESRLAQQAMNHHQIIMETGKEIEVEEAYPGPDGRTQDLHVVKSAVFGPNGEITGTQGMLFDVSERKKIEAELAYERDLLRALMEYSPDPIYFKDSQSRFLKNGKAHALIFGINRADELEGKTDFDFFAEESARPRFEDEQEIIRTGRPLLNKVEKEVYKDGRVSWSLTSKIPFRDKEGEIIGTFGISKDITAIKETEAQLEQVHIQLLDTSRKAGMAEIATNVLHNVGNVLNSVNISTGLVIESMKRSKVAGLARVVALLKEHEQDLGAFMTEDSRGKHVPAHLAQLAERLGADQETIVAELDSLRKNVEHIKEIVAMQQNYARVGGVKEVVNVVGLVEDGLRMNEDALSRHGVEVTREYGEVPPVNGEKHKILQILVNLLRNAKHACQESDHAEKRLTVRVENCKGRIRISVIDNGVGITSKNLTRIFNHGFTTRKEGHGFGLHSGALAAKEMGGSLTAYSEGPGRGAAFLLELPLTPNESGNEEAENQKPGNG